ncbi:Inosose dehydratase [Acidisarcina polymorpha]|uniref:Inosose dehydratase n=2 Tax=Acidisarcina polymorpha TaxID=2211140 RepID=A0A2Z5G194_9BACT|nr:Inosose dehydratase [Acidisarcina polymorpha]
MLDQMVWAGYEGIELGPYGFFPIEELLLPELEQRNLQLIGCFTGVRLSDPASASTVIDHVRKVVDLLSALGAPFLVIADEQSPARDKISGRVPADGSAGLSAAQWKHVGSIVAELAKLVNDYGLDLVFHPRVATYVETPEETAIFFDAASGSNVGLCLDTGHCVYAGGDPAREAEKYRHILRHVHIKDLEFDILQQARKDELTFDQAIERKIFTIIGHGDVDFPVFFNTLAKNDYRGWCVVEQDIKFEAIEIPSAVSVAESLKYLRGVVAGESASTA